MKYDSDILREIAQLERSRQRAIAELIENPDDEEARRHFNERNTLIRALRAQLSTQRVRETP